MEHFRGARCVWDVQEINPTSVFNEFKTHLRSRTPKKKFILGNGLMVKNKRHSITSRIRDIEYQIASKRQMVKQRREVQILRFKETIVIANALGIKRRSDATNLFKSSQMNLDIMTVTNPIYYIGTESLKSEIRILENRVSLITLS